MLEQLFGSKTRVKLLRLFLSNPSRPFYLRQITRLLKTQINSIRTEVNNLEKFGVIKSITLNKEELPLDLLQEIEKEKGGSNKKYFIVDTSFILYHELKALMLKAELLLEANFFEKIEKMAKPRLMILTGSFVGYENFPTDILIVGKVNKVKLSKLLKDFEKELGKPVNYTIMNLAEYKYRHDITDRFLYDILEGQKIVITDNLTQDV